MPPNARVLLATDANQQSIGEAPTCKQPIHRVRSRSLGHEVQAEEDVARWQRQGQLRITACSRSANSLASAAAITRTAIACEQRPR
jgi:predicted transposase YbfD/YdcC